MKYSGCSRSSSWAAKTAPVMPSMAGVRWISAPKRAKSRCRSTLMSSGMVMMRRYPFTADTSARPIPVLPVVGSTMVPPGFKAPLRSAASTIATPMRSFTLPPGLRDSTLASTVAEPSRGSRRRRTSGVPPIRSSTESAILSFFMSASDMVHGLRGAPALERPRHEVAEGEPVHHLRHRFRDLVPQLAQLVAGAAVAPPLRGGFEGGAAFHGAQDSAYRDLLRRLREVIAARGAALGGEQPGTLERQQHLLQVALRNGLPRRDLLDGDEPALAMHREIQHRLDGVLALGRDPHRRCIPRSSTRAASLAKYVMTMSAPARRIETSASIMARSSSSQPSWPAALIIAYSPETE